MSVTIPDADELFVRFFDRWYDVEDRKRKGFAHTRPDLLRCSPGRSGTDLSGLGVEDQAQVLGRIETMLATVSADWPRYLNVQGEISESWIDAFDRFHDTEQVASIIGRSDPEDYSNELLVTVCQFGAALALVLKAQMPRLEWVAGWPYWESSLYDPISGWLISPFHWAIKKFSSYGIDDGFTAKIQICCENMER